MKLSRLALFVMVFISNVRCSIENEKPLLFFSKMNKPVSFPTANADGHNDFGLDSVFLESQNAAEMGDTIYRLHTSSRSIFNVNGFIRLREHQVLQIMAFDEDADTSEGQWQDLFDFRTSGQSDTIAYSRNGVQYQMVVTPEQEYYYEEIMDSVISFRIIKEDSYYISRSEYLLICH